MIDDYIGDKMIPFLTPTGQNVSDSYAPLYRDFETEIVNNDAEGLNKSALAFNKLDESLSANTKDAVVKAANEKFGKDMLAILQNAVSEIKSTGKINMTELDEKHKEENEELNAAMNSELQKAKSRAPTGNRR